MSKNIKIGFSSSWSKLDSFGFVESAISDVLDKYDIQVVSPNQADYLFYSVFNGDHHAEARPDAIKIFVGGENFCPDFNACDYALSFEHLDYGKRHLRFPLYMFYPDVDQLENRRSFSSEDLAARRLFCNFIYSNRDAEPDRDAIFVALNERIFVHSAGRHLSNTENLDSFHPELKPNARKRRYMEQFRFSLALENSTHPGYVTEKIADALIARTIPIYWGDPRIADEFNPEAFVNLHDFANRRDAVDHIVALSMDEGRMLSMLNADPFKSPDQASAYRGRLRAFLENIFDQPLDLARQRPRAGFVGALEKRRRRDEFGYRKLLGRNKV
jgi:alpha(1,3/1,4) fucosyltransferase